MPSQTYRLEGIVLKSLNFQDNDKILTVFSRDLGLVKLIVKKGNTKHCPAHLTSPLSQGEFIYSKGNSDLLKCQEISPINNYFNLRENLEELEASCDMLQSLLDSQPPHTPSSHLYDLCCSYFSKMPAMEYPQLLADSFRLKILRHDGLLNLNPVCSICTVALEAHYVSSGESFCRLHAPRSALLFDQNESAAIVILAYCHTFAQLKPLIFTPELRLKIKQLFVEQIAK